MTDENDKDPISKALGVNPLVATNVVQDIIATAHDDSAKQDFETARANILTMLEGGHMAMEKLAQIADSSQHPRAFEVYAKLMDTMINANKELLELQTKIREIDTADAPINDKAKTINNNLFVGTTAELQKMIENLRNGGTEKS